MCCKRYRKDYRFCPLEAETQVRILAGLSDILYKKKCWGLGDWEVILARIGDKPDEE
jgi:hypothetical protein